MQKPRPDLLKDLSEILPEPTAHGSGNKYVFRSNDEMPNASTQVAFGRFRPGEVCEEHIHPTMYEYFFFISGKGTYKIEGKNYKLKPDTFLEIPAGMKHSLHADGDQELLFVYWGVATEES